MAFPTKPLRECARLASGGTPSKSNPIFWGGPIAWLTPKDMSRFDGTTQDSVTRGAIGNGTREASAESLFIAVRGMSLHNEIRVVRPKRKMAFNQDIKAITPVAAVDGRFLHYALLAKIPDLLDAVEAAGHGTGVLPTDKLNSLPIPDLPLSEQRAIAATLGALDDKIELNRRMNETLEAMARALFRDWFVDFGPTRAKMAGTAPTLSDDLWPLFPDRLDADGKPEGWEIRTLGDVADQIAMGPFGSNIKVETFVEEGIPVISGAHLRGLQLHDKSYNFVTAEHADKLGRSNVRRGDVVFTHAGNIGQVAIIPETAEFDRYVISQRQFYMRCNRQLMSPLFVVHYFHSPEGKHTLLANSSQVGVPSIARPATYLKSIEICCPPRALLDEFDRAVSAIHLKVGKNEIESRTLAQTRDLLLPRLMSGALRIAQAERNLEEVA